MNIWILFASFFSALAIAWLSVPSLVRVAEEKHLFDEPDETRKIHQARIPTLGGIAIFGGSIISCAFFINFSELPQWGYALSAIVLLFFTGVKDDIIPLSPAKKFMAQLIAALIIVMKSDIRLTSMYGFLWIDTIPYYASVLLSLFTVLVIINAFNLLDGVNGLAGGISFIASLVFAYFFYQLQAYNWAIIALSLAGSLVGFLYYNLRKKAQIFMGDTGSLLIGLFLAIFAIVFIEQNNTIHLSGKGFCFKPPFAPVLAISILLLPLFDTLRVFCVRIANKRSPFSGDRNHLHHYLVDSGLSHPISSLVLYGVHLFFIGVVFLFADLPQTYAVLTMLLLAFALSIGLYYYKQNNQPPKKKPETKTNLEMHNV
jgi:UDP-N-acetylmuramyl pentapeptide phosphotransferase/UDP-N-acetylglucosamine-1-phosphate transferase